MTEEDILKRLRALSDATAEKTADGVGLETCLEIQNALRTSAWIYRTDGLGIGGLYLGDSAAEALARAEAAVAALPDAKTLRREKVQRDLAKLIEDCAAADIDTSFVNPLREMAKKLSENAITCEAAQ